MKLNPTEVLAMLVASGIEFDSAQADALTARLNVLASPIKRNDPRKSKSGNHRDRHVDETRYQPVLDALRRGDRVSTFAWSGRGFPRIGAYVERLRYRGWNIETLDSDTRGAVYQLDADEPFRAGFDFRPRRGGFFRN